MDYRTMKGYRLKNKNEMTDALEDYLEMICRMERQGKSVRVGEIAKALHVKPSSVSKMIAHLKSLGYVRCEKYSAITPTHEGREAGNYLLYRHEVLQRFLCILNGTADETVQVEQIEHFFDRNTINNLAKCILRRPTAAGAELNGRGAAATAGR